MNPIVEKISNSQKKADRSNFKVGDGVKVYVKVREGDKERVQIFAGIVISKKGSGINETFIVRRIASGIGVERVFPVHSPSIEKIVVDRTSQVMKRAKLFNLRGLQGKEATKVKTKTNQ